MTQLHDRMLKFLSSVFFFRHFLLLENGNKNSIFSWVLSQNFSHKKTVKQWKISKTAKLNEKLAFSEVYSMPRSQNFLKVLLLNPHQDFEIPINIFWAWVTKSFTAKNRSSYFSWNKPQQGRNRKKKKKKRERDGKKFIDSLCFRITFKEVKRFRATVVRVFQIAVTGRG